MICVSPLLRMLGAFLCAVFCVDIICTLGFEHNLPLKQKSDKKVQNIVNLSHKLLSRDFTLHLL